MTDAAHGSTDSSSDHSAELAEHDEDGYDGPAVLVAADGAEVSVRAVLAARFSPVAGRLTWSGRVSGDGVPGLAVPAAYDLRTPHDTRPVRATERDVWGNVRVSGEGRAPFAVALQDSTVWRTPSSQG